MAGALKKNLRLPTTTTGPSTIELSAKRKPEAPHSAGRESDRPWVLITRTRNGQVPGKRSAHTRKMLCDLEAAVRFGGVRRTGAIVPSCKVKDRGTIEEIENEVCARS